MQKIDKVDEKVDRVKKRLRKLEQLWLYIQALISNMKVAIQSLTAREA